MFSIRAYRLVDSIRQGHMSGAIAPDKKLPHTATKDIGAAAAQLLLDLSWTGQIDIPALGPEEYSYNDLPRIITEVTGHQVRCV